MEAKAASLFFMLGRLTSIQQVDNQTLRPVTIKQLLDATQPHPDAAHQVDGADIGSVYIVGQVRNISMQSTNITYKIDDGTGEIEARQYIDSTTAQLEDSMDVDGTGTKTAAGAGSKNKVELNGFVKAFGKVRVFGNRRFLGAHSVRPVKDINEIHTHFLEATAVHLFFTRGLPPTANGGAKAVGGAGPSSQDMYGATTTTTERPLPAITPAARRVYNLLKNEPPSHEGLHMQNISVKLGMSTTEVMKAGDELIQLGLIYSTVDELTWAILEY